MNEAGLTIDDARPSLTMGKTTAVFQDSTVLMDDTVVTMDSVTALMGGSDSFSDIGPPAITITNL